MASSATAVDDVLDQASTCTETPERPAIKSTQGAKSMLLDLFDGSLSKDLINPYPKMDVNEEASLHDLLRRVKQLLDEKIDPARIDLEAQIPETAITAMKDLGLYGALIPEEYGGLGLSRSAHCALLGRVAAHCASSAEMLRVQSSTGVLALLMYGDEELKARYLPELATGELELAVCLCEENSGEDLADIEAQAELQGDGSYCLSGSKVFVSNAGNADLFAVFAKTVLAKTGATHKQATDGPHLSCFVVKREQAGVTIAAAEDKLGQRGGTRAGIRFDRVKIPADQRIGADGCGVRIVRDLRMSGRLSAAAASAGTARKLLELSLARAKANGQIDAQSPTFGLTRKKFAMMAAELYSMDSLVYLVAGLADRQLRGKKPADTALESIAAKIYCSTRLWEIADEVLQLRGIEGLSRRHADERHLRDARSSMFLEGSNEALRLSLAMQCIEPHSKELEDIMTGLKSIGGFLPSLGSLIKLQFGAGRALHCPVEHSDMSSRAWKHVEFCLHALPQGAHTALARHGEMIGREQESLAILADMTCEALVALAVFARTFRHLAPDEADWLHCSHILRKKRRKMAALIRELGRKDSTANDTLTQWLSEVEAEQPFLY